MTWVLLVFSLATYGATSVPGYKTEAECKAAAAIVSHVPEGYRRGNFYGMCIPGPA